MPGDMIWKKKLQKLCPGVLYKKLTLNFDFDSFWKKMDFLVIYRVKLKRGKNMPSNHFLLRISQ